MTNKTILALLESYGNAERSKVVTPDKNQGIKIKHWFWAALESLAPKAKRESTGTISHITDDSALPKTPEELIAQNPAIGASTLLNMLKSEGYEIKKKEADSSSAFVANTRESQRPHGARFSFRTRLVEASYRDDGIGPTKFRVVLLQEGMGNSRDSYYYSREALISSVSVFEGKKIYSDHPTLTEEETRPERSVKDILGYFENVGVEEQPNGCMALVGDVNILPDKPFEWARALLRNAVDYAKKFPDKEFVGLSINANGDASEFDINEVLKTAPEGAKQKLSKALESGTNIVRVVSKIDEAVSCDLVTEAGAGGKIISLLEADTMKKQELKEASGVAPEMKEEKGLAPGMEEGFPIKDEDKKDEECKEGEEEPKHDDAEEDKALIKKMLDEQLGAEGHGEEESSHAYEAFKCAMESGESKEEALKCAGYAMKMAKHMASKKESMEKMESEKKEEKPMEAHKESAEVIKLKGENAKLKESLAQIEVSKHLDITLRESGLRMEITKKFRDIVGTPKSKKEIDEKFKLFVEGYRNSISGETDSYEWLATATEKASPRMSDNSVVDLSDC